MKICVVDLENNTPQTEWQRSQTERVEWAPIIEIGAVMLDIRSGKIVDIYDVFINPGELIFPEITALTGITDKDVNGPESTDLTLGLLNFLGWLEINQCKMVAAWGRDVDEIEQQCLKVGLTLPRKLRKLDIKSMFEILKAGLPNRRIKGGLKATLETFDMDFEGTPHRAGIDAFNTAKLLYRAKELMHFVDSIKGHEFRGIQRGK